MKSKRLITLLIIFVFIATCVIFSSTVFTLQKIEFNWLTSRVFLYNETESSLLEDVKIPMGDSVFLINKDKIIKGFEESNPYIEIVSIETTFPNKIVVHIAERRQLYAIKTKENKFAVIDKSLKVLNIVDSDELLLILEGNRPVEVSIEGHEISATDFEIGQFIDIDGADEILKRLTTSLIEARYQDQSIRGFISSVKMELENEKNIEILTRYGMKIQIKDSSSRLTEKLMLAIGAFKNNHSKHITYGKIEIFESFDNNIYAVHSYEL